MSPASGKMLKMSYNTIRSLITKAITVACVAHKFFMNLCKHSPN